MTDADGNVISSPSSAPSTATYAVVLNTRPAANVVVNVNVDPSVTDLQVTPLTLTFTPSDWSVAQTVTVQAIDDQIAQGDYTTTITHTVASTDPNYNGIAVAGVPVSVIDADVAAIAPALTGETDQLPDDGSATLSYTVELTSQPVADVTVTVGTSDQLTASASQLTFTSVNWDTAQTVTLTASAGAAAFQGTREVDLPLTAASADPQYQGLTSSVSAQLMDADGLNAMPINASGNEGSSTTVSVSSTVINNTGMSFVVTAVTQPADGSATINADGTITYTPASGWTGSDTFSYTVSEGPVNNGSGMSDTGTIAVDVSPVNQPPQVTNPGPQIGHETYDGDPGVSLQIQATDLDPNGDSLLFTAQGLPPGLTINPQTGLIHGWIDPQVTLAPAHAAVTFQCSVTADDLDGGVTTVNFPWTVTHTDHPPRLLCVPDVVSLQDESWNSPVPFLEYNPVSAVDIDGSTLTYSVTGLPPGISYATVNNQCVFSGQFSASGVYNVTVTVSDGEGGTDSDTGVWTILPQADMSNPLPLAAVSTSASAARWVRIPRFKAPWLS